MDGEQYFRSQPGEDLRLPDFTGTHLIRKGVSAGAAMICCSINVVQQYPIVECPRSRLSR